MARPTLVIMAAGMGSRYGGLKQIDPVGPSGELIIDYSIYDAIKAGFSKVVFIIRHYFEEAFRDKIGRTIESRIDTEYVFQELDVLPTGFEVPAEREKPWGTAHAVLCAQHAVDTPFAVINADDFYGAGSFRVLAEYLAEARDVDNVYNFCMVGYVMKNTLSDHGHVARGACTVRDGLLEKIVELTKIRKFGDEVKYSEDDGQTWIKIDPDCTVSMNMFGYTPGMFEELGSRFPGFLEENISNPGAEFFIPVVTSDLIAEGKATVTILPTDERWLGVTYREDVPPVTDAIRGLVESGAYPSRLWD